jgi:DNA-directed RNA polymerase subunit E'/Rpb7
MENQDIFVKTLITDVVKLKPNQLGKNYAKHITELVKNRNEGMCTKYGFIRPKSIDIFKISMGQVQPQTLNGYTLFNISFYADVCNPAVETVVKAQVINTNKFGILAQAGIRDNDIYLPILEIIIARHAVGIQSAVDLDKIKVGDVIDIEVIGKKFELYDKKISVIGKIVKSTTKSAAKTKTDDDDEEAEEEDDVLSVGGGDSVLSGGEELSEEEGDAENEEAEEEIDEDNEEDVEDEEEISEDFELEDDNMDLGSDGSAIEEEEEEGIEDE